MRTRQVIAVAAGAAVLVAGVVLMPRVPQLSTETSGDPALIDQVMDGLDSGTRDRLSVAVFDEAGATTAHFGATDDTVYEIGSVTKTVTAALYADALDRGEVTSETALGDLLDLGDSAASRVTLESLATQSSGLPRLPSTPDVLLASVVSNFTASDPYRFGLDQLESQAEQTAVGQPGYSYSNLGFALLGQALASAAGTEYSALVQERMFDAIGMPQSAVPVTADRLPDAATTGYTSGGRPADAWTLDANAPAGGVRSTTADMVRYGQALLDGSAPGAEALDPRADAGDLDRIGYAWFTTEGITWHNGMTGGFASFIGLDRETGRGVVILSNTAVAVDDLGFALLEGER